MNEEKPKRSIWISFLPYLLLLIAIGAFVTIIVINNVNKVDTWAVNEIDKNLTTYQVKNVRVSEGTKSTVISGDYMDSDNKYHNYSVRVDSAQYEDSWALTYDEKGEPLTYHESWSYLFTEEVNLWNTNHPDDKATYVVNDAFAVSWWDSWGPTIILLAGTLLIAIFLFSRLSSSVSGSNNKALDFNKSRARREDTSKIRFTDVAGCDEEKAEMVEIVDYLKQPKKYSKYGAKLPKGVLLVGPPGTGKTLLAKAVAGEAGVPFYSISGSDFVEMFVGVGAGRVRDMFRRAKQTAPCLIFIDEIDAVGRQRGAGLGGGNDEREQTLNQLLVEMDGFEDNSGIIVIAATNREDVLDPALLRAGRFDRQITVSLPDRQGRADIFRVHARNKNIDPNVNFDDLARRTVGFSGADIENILNEAAILAVRYNHPIVTLKDIDEAVDRRIAGPAKSSRALNPLERKEIAYHEAGHAIIGLNLEHSDKVQKITIIPRGQTGGHVLMTPDEDRFLLTKKELEARIVGYLGGRSSEEVFFNDISTGAHNDIEVATRIARLMVTEYGMSSLGPIQYEKDSNSVFLGRDYNSTQKNFSTQVAYEIDSEVRKIINDAHKKAVEIIEAHRDDVILIAETLLDRETITAEEISYLLKNRNLPKEDKDAQVNKEIKAVEQETPKTPQPKDDGSKAKPEEKK
jgi:cell division protease FtsH